MSDKNIINGTYDLNELVSINFKAFYKVAIAEYRIEIAEIEKYIRMLAFDHDVYMSSIWHFDNGEIWRRFPTVQLQAIVQARLAECKYLCRQCDEIKRCLTEAKETHGAGIQ